MKKIEEIYEDIIKEARKKKTKSLLKKDQMVGKVDAYDIKNDVKLKDQFEIWIGPDDSNTKDIFWIADDGKKFPQSIGNIRMILFGSTRYGSGEYKDDSIDFRSGNYDSNNLDFDMKVVGVQKIFNKLRKKYKPEDFMEG